MTDVETRTDDPDGASAVYPIPQVLYLTDPLATGPIKLQYDDHAAAWVGVVTPLYFVEVE